MTWVLPFVALLGGLVLFLFTGVPVGIGFGIVNILAVLFILGSKFFPVLVYNCSDALANFLYIAIPLFILMGEVLLHSGLSDKIVHIINQWLSKVPARLAVVTAVSSAIFGALTGSSMSTCAALGPTLIPQMRAHHYEKQVSVCIVAASGVLAILIPPSALTILYSGLSDISAGKLLIATILPGILLVILYSTYLIIRALLQPEFAPRYTEKIDYGKLIRETAIHSGPVAIIILSVIGLIYTGLATPSEAAAAGCVASFLVAFAYGKFGWAQIKSTLLATVRVTGMIFFIMVGSKAFSQLLALTGAGHGFSKLVLDLPIPPWAVLWGVIAVLIFLGCFIDQASIMFITIPIFIPVLEGLKFDMIWVGVMYLTAIEIGLLTPPFGLNLFVTRAIAPPDTTLEDIFRGIMPFVLINILFLVVIFFFPSLATSLPNRMMK